MDALFNLYKFHDSLKTKEKIVIKQGEFERDIIKPLEKLFLSKAENKEHATKPTALQNEKNVSPTFIKIYHRLEDKGADLSGIGDVMKSKKASQITAYKMMNIYVKHFDLKEGIKSRLFVLDDFLKGCFDDDVLSELHAKNNSEMISQGQLNKLASLLLDKN
jgi:hypothetical protein